MKPLKRFLIIGFIALVLNLIWEFSHYSLYIDLSGIPKYQHLIIASLADTLILFCIFMIVSLKNENFKQVKYQSYFDYLLVVFMGLAVAILIELINLNLSRWEYTKAMPTLLGIGISPLIQLALTGIVSLAIINYLEK